MIRTVYRSACDLPLFWCGFNETWIIDKFSKKILKYKISWKSSRWEPSYCMRTDGQTWRS